MKSILFNADDWGLSLAIHESIVTLHKAAAIDAAGIMMGQAHTDNALSYAAANPDLWTGLHLFANDPDCNPMSLRRWPFLWPRNGGIHTRLKSLKLRETILTEIEAQMIAWKAAGLPLHFINSHFHFHANVAFEREFLDLFLRHFPDFDGWIRYGASRLLSVRPGTFGTALFERIESLHFRQAWEGWHNDTLLGLDRAFRNTSRSIVAACDSLGPGFHEFFFHPGRGGRLNRPGTDHRALMELADAMPREKRNHEMLRQLRPQGRLPAVVPPN